MREIFKIDFPYLSKRLDLYSETNRPVSCCYVNKLLINAVSENYARDNLNRKIYESLKVSIVHVAVESQQWHQRPLSSGKLIDF